MGLDMHLTAELFLWTKERKEMTELVNEQIYTQGLEVEKIVIDVGDWCKATHIHQWFVENVQEGIDECNRTYVPTEKLVELKEICEAIAENHSLAEEALPTTTGFFFGNTEYDECYFDDINHTIGIITKAEPLFYEMDFYYESSW